MNRLLSARRPRSGQPPRLDPRLRIRYPVIRHDRLRRDLSAFGRREFTVGLRVGLVTVAIAVALWYTFRSRLRPGSVTTSATVLPVAGLLMAVAYLEALRESGHLLPGMAAGVVLLAVGGEVARRRQLGAVGHSLLAVPGAVVLATFAGLQVLPAWTRLLICVAIVMSAFLVDDVDARGTLGALGLVLMVVTVAGVYETVPEPGLLLPQLAIVLPMALLAWPVPRVALGGSASALAGELLWAAAIGGRGRLPSVVGAIGCLGLFVAEPVARRLDPKGRGLAEFASSGPRAVCLLAAGHLAVVYVAARVAGLRHELRLAIAIAVANAVGSILGVAIVCRLLRRQRPGATERRMTIED